jgi:hypothetical protein
MWTPIFDEQPTGSVGDVATSSVEPRRDLHPGSGKSSGPSLSTGDGIYKSTDAGKTWLHLGLRDGRQIGSVIVSSARRKQDLRRSAGSSHMGPTPSANLSVYERRRDLRARALQGREHGRGAGCGFDPSRSARSSIPPSGRDGRTRGKRASWNGPLSGLFKSMNGGTMVADRRVPRRPRAWAASDSPSLPAIRDAWRDRRSPNTRRHLQVG